MRIAKRKKALRRTTLHRPATLCGVGLVLALISQQSVGQRPLSAELNGHVTIATDARDHGLSQLYDGSTSFRVGLDLALPSGLFAGAIASNVDYATEALSPQPRERLLELYAGYLWQRSNWSVTAMLGHYLYPDIAIDYDYTELAAVISYRGRVFYEVSYTNDYLSLGRKATAQEVGFAWPLPGDVELSASVGEFNFDGYAPRYTHHNIGLSKQFGPVSVDVRYYDTSRDIVSRLGTSVGDDWVLSVSYAINLRD